MYLFVNRMWLGDIRETSTNWNSSVNNYEIGPSVRRPALGEQNAQFVFSPYEMESRILVLMNSSTSVLLGNQPNL